MNRTIVKICGIRSPDDASAAVEAGADAIGLNFYPPSRRFVTMDTARAIVAAVGSSVACVGVFVDAATEQVAEVADLLGLAAVQLHGMEPASVAASFRPRSVIKAFGWRGMLTRTETAAYWSEATACGHAPAALLLDTFRPGVSGGTGVAWNWNELVPTGWPAPVYLAGGLHAGNVAAAIDAARPYAVDVAGGVENSSGFKDRHKMAAFLAAVREADAKLSVS